MLSTYRSDREAPADPLASHATMPRR